MNLNPPLPFPVTVTLLILAAVVMVRLGYTGTAALPRRIRILLATLRAGAFAALALVLLNPGVTAPLREERPTRWVILTDTSASMAARDAESGPTRHEEALVCAKKALAHAESTGVKTSLFAFDTAATPVSAETLEKRPADGTGSDPVASAQEALVRAESLGDVSGILVLTDARSTASTAPDDLIARSRSHGAPVTTLLLGGEKSSHNLVLHPARRNLAAYPEARVRLDFVLENRGLPAAGLPVTLKDAAGVTVAETVVDAPADGRARGALTFRAPARSGLYTLATPRRDGESIAADNTRPILVRALPRRTRTLLIEGAPSWDTKFIAQFLRGQPGFEVRAIHRIADDRIFESDTAHGLETVPGFPADDEALAAYDLIILGKGVDALVGAPECRRLESWVKQHGGTLLLARGNPVSGDTLPALAALSPLEWTRAAADDLRLTPSPEGESAGLFGGVIPGLGDPVWSALPALDNIAAAGARKPFARWLASTPSASGASPIVATRRLGSGAVAAVNAEGLWRWHLAAPTLKIGDLYADFWNQLLRVLADEAEFAPGRALAITASTEVASINEPVTLSVTRRAASAPVPAKLVVTDPRGGESSLGLSPASDASGRAVFRASFEPRLPGAHLLRVCDATGAPLGAETCVESLPPPMESDNLSASPELAKALARATSGEVILPSGFDRWLAEHMRPAPPVESATGTRRMPAPVLPWAAAAGVALLAAEWFIRRRKGLN